GRGAGVRRSGCARTSAVSMLSSVGAPTSGRLGRGSSSSEAGPSPLPSPPPLRRSEAVVAAQHHLPFGHGGFASGCRFWCLGAFRLFLVVLFLLRAHRFA